MTAPAPARSWLHDWVQPQHLEPQAVERFRARFTGDALHLLLIPNFLVTDVADRLAGFLEREAHFTRQFAVTSPGPGDGAVHEDGDHYERLVSEDEFLATPPEQQFLRFAVGPGQPERLSAGWMRYLAFRAAMHDARLAAYFEQATGVSLGPVSSLSAHAMAVGDMLAPHNDTNKRRRMAFILYLTPGWEAAFGGSLLITGLDNALTRVVPAFNTMVLFEVTSHRFHRVEPIAPAAGPARRLSVSGWFDHPAPAT